MTKATSSARRFITRIELTPASRSKLSALVETNGMTQVATISRLLDWFSCQSPVIHAVVLGKLPAEIAPDVARLILQKMAEKKAEA
jgi:hypothetical protein